MKISDLPKPLLLIFAVGLISICLMLLSILFSAPRPQPELKTEPAVTPSPLPTPAGKYFIDPISKISFLYPMNWSVTNIKPGESAQIGMEDAQILIEIIPNPTKLTPEQFLSQKIFQIQTQLEITPYPVRTNYGIQAKNFPESTLIHTLHLISRTDDLIQITLNTANEDSQIALDQILTTMTFR